MSESVVPPPEPRTVPVIAPRQRPPQPVAPPVALSALRFAAASPAAAASSAGGQEVKPPPKATCWDILAGRTCPRGIACVYCQADNAARNLMSKGPTPGGQVAFGPLIRRLAAQNAGASATPRTMPMIFPRIDPKQTVRPPAQQLLHKVATIATEIKWVTVSEFPQHWQEMPREEVVKTISAQFEVFGEFSKPPILSDQGRRAHVAFKDADSARKAVEALSGCDFQVNLGMLPKTTGPPGGAQPLAVAGPCRTIVIHIDELAMASRPEVTPSLTDREVWLDPMPLQPNEELAEWLEAFGEVEEIFRLCEQDSGGDAERGYVLFKERSGAEACIKAGIGVWSESERAIASHSAAPAQGRQQGTARAYPESLVSKILGRAGTDINAVRVGAGARKLAVGGEGLSIKPTSKRLHFVAEGDDESLKKLRTDLDAHLKSVHEEMALRMREIASGIPADGDEAGALSADGAGGNSKTPGGPLHSIHIDELDMPQRPEVEPVITDREVWVDPLPDAEDLEEWLKAFGAVQQVFRVPDSLTGEQSEKGYVVFQKHESAKACVEAGAGAWSESERLLSWRLDLHGTAMCSYPISVVSKLLGHIGAFSTSNARKASGVRHISISGDGIGKTSVSRRVHFVAECDEAELLTVRVELERILAAAHEDVDRHLQGDTTEPWRAEQERKAEKFKRSNAAHAQVDRDGTAQEGEGDADTSGGTDSSGKFQFKQLPASERERGRPGAMNNQDNKRRRDESAADEPDKKRRQKGGGPPGAAGGKGEAMGRGQRGRQRKRDLPPDPLAAMAMAGNVCRPSAAPWMAGMMLPMVPGVPPPPPPGPPAPLGPPGPPGPPGLPGPPPGWWMGAARPSSAPHVPPTDFAAAGDPPPGDFDGIEDEANVHKRKQRRGKRRPPAAEK